MEEAVGLSRQAFAVGETVSPLPLKVLDAAETQRGVGVAPALKVFVGLQLGLAVACFAAELVCAFLLHKDGAYTYALRTRSQNCWDFTLFAGKFAHFGQADFFRVDPEIPFTYPAPVAVAYEAFFRYKAHPLALFLGFIVAAFGTAAALLARALRRCGMTWVQAAGFCGASVVLSYPLWFELKQGNIEICVWVLVALGLWAFAKGRGYSAAACFGIAGSMKIFPFVYLGLLLARRRYREIAFAGLVAAGSMAASLALVGPGIKATWRATQAGVAFFRTTYILTFRQEEIGFDHSLFGVYKQVFHHTLPGPEALGHRLSVYMAVAAVGGVALYFLRIWRLPVTNQVLCLSVASVLLPPISFDYTLLHLYVPWAVLVLLAQSSWRRGERVAGLAGALVLMAVVFSPESEVIHHATHLGGQVKAVALMGLMGVGLVYRFPHGIAGCAWNDDEGQATAKAKCGDSSLRSE